MDTQTLLIVGLAAGAAFLFTQSRQRRSGGGNGGQSAPQQQPQSAGQVIGSTINEWFSWNGEVF